MVKQGRNQSGKFAPKSDEPRSVRTMRLTDTAWIKLGEIADSRGITRADLIEEWARQPAVAQVDQLTLFDMQHGDTVPDREVITTATRKTGTELAHRLDVSSAALTNWLKSGNFAERSRARDPNGIAWKRESGTRNYQPIL